MTSSLPALPRTLVLGSTSRYRKELLQRLGLPFETASPQVDETPQPGEAPAALATRLALEKARDVARRHPGAVVIGSDQVADLAHRKDRTVPEMERWLGPWLGYEPCGPDGAPW